MLGELTRRRYGSRKVSKLNNLYLYIIYIIYIHTVKCIYETEANSVQTKRCTRACVVEKLTDSTFGRVIRFNQW